MVQSNLLQSVFKPIPCVSAGLWLRESIKHIDIHQLPLTALFIDKMVLHNHNYETDS